MLTLNRFNPMCPRHGGGLQRGHHALLRQHAREGQLPRDGGRPLPTRGREGSVTLVQEDRK